MKSNLIHGLALALLLPCSALAWDSPTQAMTALQDEWAIVNYQVKGDEQQKRFEQLLTQAEDAIKQYPDSAEVYVWQGIIQSTAAGAAGGLDALSLVKASRSALEKAIELDPNALAGSAYTSLGALYYKVPSWPVAFGSDKKARSYLEQALTLNPDGIDSNYFYAEFLFEEGDYQQAMQALEKAARAPARPGREVADEGRRAEIASLKSKISAKLGH